MSQVLMTWQKMKLSLMDRLTILRAELTRAITNPLYDEPENYVVLLDVIQDAIDKEESNA